MKYFGRATSVSTTANASQVQLFQDLLDKKLIHDVEEAIRSLHPSVWKVFQFFSHAEIDTALGEATATGSNVIVLEGSAYSDQVLEDIGVKAIAEQAARDKDAETKRVAAVNVATEKSRAQTLVVAEANARMALADANAKVDAAVAANVKVVPVPATPAVYDTRYGRPISDDGTTFGHVSPGQPNSAVPGQPYTAPVASPAHDANGNATPGYTHAPGPTPGLIPTPTQIPGPVSVPAGFPNPAPFPAPGQPYPTQAPVPVTGQVPAPVAPFPAPAPPAPATPATGNPFVPPAGWVPPSGSNEPTN